MTRLPMRKIREALRLEASGLSTRSMASSLGVGRTTLREYLGRARSAGLSWPLPDNLSDSALEELLFPSSPSVTRGAFTQPDWVYVHDELRRKGVTLALLAVLRPIDLDFNYTSNSERAELIASTMSAFVLALRRPRPPHARCDSPIATHSARSPGSPVDGA